MTILTRTFILLSSLLTSSIIAQPIDYEKTELAKAEYVAARGISEATLISTSSAHQFYEDAYRFEALGDYQRAVSYYSRTLLMNPNHAEARFNRAFLWYEMGHFAQAKTEFDYIIEQDHMDAEAYEIRGLAQYQNQHFEAAIEDFNKAFSLSGKEDLLLHRGIALTQAGFFKDAMLDLDKLIQSNPKNAAALAARGDVLLALQRYQPALHWYDKAIELTNTDAFTYCNRGTVHTQIGDFEAAINDFEKALQLQPNSQIFTNLAYCYFEMGEVFMTKKMSILAMQYDPDNTEAYYLIGLAELANEEPELAIGSFDIALESDPNNIAFLLAKAESYLQMEAYYSAIENCNMVLDQERNHLAATEMLNRSLNGLEAHNLELLKQQPTALAPQKIEENQADSTDDFYEDPYGN